MSFITLRALLFVAECLLASVLLPLLAFAATCFLRRAALRHLTWLTMFAVLALLPLAALLLPARQIVLAEPVLVSAPIESIALPPMAPLKAIAAPSPAMEGLPEIRKSMRIPTLTVPSAPAPLLTPENGLLLLLLFWALGFAWNIGRMILGMAGLARLRRDSELFRHDEHEVRISAGITGPATFGIVRPLVLLPETARHWSPARLDAVLAHEAAHVRRRDIAGQSLARLVCAFFWFNPLLWLAARALRCEAELAADDAVLAAGMTPSAYAAELVALAGEILRPSPAVRALGAGMADSPLMTRVQSVLAANVSRKGVTAMDMARMLVLGLAATLLLGTARVDLALAQDKPAAPARPATAAPAAAAARPAPAAPPARNAAPRIEIDADRALERKVEIEIEAVKAGADAAAAKARVRAEAEKDPAKRAQYAQEAARVAADAARVKADADRMGLESRQQMAAYRISLEQQRRMREAERAARDAQTEAQEAQRRAQGNAQRAEEARLQADETRRALEGAQRESALSDEAGMAEARRQKLTISPAELNERIRRLQDSLGPQQAELQRQRVLMDIMREKMAALQNGDAAASRGPALSGTYDAGQPDPFAAARTPGLNAGPIKADVVGRFRSNNVNIDAQVEAAMAELAPEARDAVRATVAQAVKDAGNRIDAAIANAKAGTAADGRQSSPQPFPPPR